MLPAVLLLPLLLVAPDPELEPPAIALVGAELVTEPGAEPLADATVVVRDGRIEALGAGLEVPHDAQRVDVAGLRILPGFLDAAHELELTFAPREAVQGEPYDDRYDVFPAMLDSNRLGLAPEREVWTVLPQDAADRQAHRERGFTALQVSPGRWLLSGASAWVAASGAPPRDAILRPRAAQFGALTWRGRDGGDYEGTAYPGTLMGVMAHLRQVLLDAERRTRLAARYASGARAQRPPADPVLVALEPVLSGAVPLVLHADVEEDIRLALGLREDFPDLELVILGGREAYEVADQLAGLDVPVVHTLAFGDEPDDPDTAEDESEASSREGRRRGRRPGRGEDEPAETSDEDAPDEADETDEEPEDPAEEARPAGPFDVESPLRLQRERRRLWERDVAGVAALADAGVRLAFASGARDPEALLDAVRDVVSVGGLDRDAALEVLVAGPRRVFGGPLPGARLAAGAPAHLVAWEGDFADAEGRARVVVSDGELFDLRSREEREGGAQDEDAGEQDEQDEDSGAGEDAGEDRDAAGWPVEIEADREPSLRTGGSVLITGATILTADPARERIEDGSILIVDGRIEALGTDLEAPDGVRVVDASGRFAIPGIVDCHSHAAIRGGINEWTRSITCEVTIEDEIDPDDVNLYRALAGGATASRLLHGSANAIGGRHEVIKHRWGLPAPGLVMRGAPRGVKFALGENPRRVNWGDRSGSRYPNTRMGVETVYRRAFEAARRYADGWAAYERGRAAGLSLDPPRRDLRLEALAGILDGSIGVHSHCYRADEILMLIRIAEDYGFGIRTFQHVLEGYKVAAEIAAHGAGGSTFADWWAYKVEAYDAIPYNAALMHEAGVVTSINSDSAEHLRRLHLEAAKCVKYGGMSAGDALRTVTLYPAMQLGIDDRVGSLAVGKDGDVAIFSHDPFDVRTRCEMTFVDGELYFERRAGTYDDWIGEVRRRVLDAQDALAASGGGEPAGTNGGTDGGEAARAVPDLSVLALPEAGTRAPSTPPRPPAPPLALVGGTVHTMDAAGVIEEGTVLVRDGRVERVGRDLAVPDGYTRVDASGRHVWPGLICAGTSLGLGEIGAVAATIDRAEIGGVQPDVRAATAYHPDSAHIPVARVNGVTSALVVPSGGSISGQASLLALEGWTTSEALVRDPLALRIDAPRTRRDPDSKTPLAERVEESWSEIRAWLEDAREYARLAAAAAERDGPGPEYDPRLAALAPYAYGRAPILVEANAPDEIADTLDFAREQGLQVVVTGGREAWKVADRLAIEDVPVLIGPVLTLPGRHDPYDATYANAAVLHRAGVRFAFRNRRAGTVRNMPYDAAMAVAHGLPESAALEALTIGAARILGADDVLGSLAPGKRADLIVTDGSPLQILTRVEELVIGGRRVALTSRHTDLYERYRSRLHEPERADR